MANSSTALIDAAVLLREGPTTTAHFRVLPPKTATQAIDSASQCGLANPARLRIRPVYWVTLVCTPLIVVLNSASLLEGLVT